MSKRPNINFIISHCLTYILTNGKKLPKYHQQHIAASNKIKDNKRKNTRTKTFFCFSFKKIAFYFGTYFSYYCTLPVSFIMLNNHYICYLHHKFLEFYQKVKLITNDEHQAKALKKLKQQGFLDELH